MTGAHIIQQDNGSADFIDKCLILTGLATQSSFYHGLMSQYGSEALVVILYGNLRHGLAPPIDKLLNTRQVFAGLTVGLSRLAYDDTFYRLALHIAAKIIKQFMSRNSCQPASYQL